MTNANLDIDYSGAADSAGNLTIKITPRNMIQWLIRQVNIELQLAPGAASPVGATCRWRKNGGAGSPLVPDNDTAGGEPGVMLRPSDAMTIEWTGLNAGTIGRATAFYDEIAWGA